MICVLEQNSYLPLEDSYLLVFHASFPTASELNFLVRLSSNVRFLLASVSG
jgi:hypothetical protein